LVTPRVCADACVATAASAATATVVVNFHSMVFLLHGKRPIAGG
jgi:p-aminobenzoyl-glutamate transporter AbgT